MWTPRSAGDWLAVALAGVASASVIAGLVIIGGPSKARDIQRDDMRLQAVVSTAEALNCYSRGIGPLPGDMQVARRAIAEPGSPARLAQGCSNVDWKDDPISGEPFEIRPVDTKQAEICAVFARPGDGDAQSYYYGYGAAYINAETTRPEAGQFCYTVNLTAEPG
ncbi:hypothetical protein [Hyphomonas oceanitis]|uniref:Type II secretion system protein n=1 Tax=Hyphomonas oceanitis SCH89 TaxID=1280953 RepID=A0A059G9F6_9PROT|nr:hypothetical protein [Hyphomonas oceanitis]KDA03349.1 hypothetical protein HOC_05678 [Hyphomonas oceanitis SCH89]